MANDKSGINFNNIGIGDGIGSMNYGMQKGYQQPPPPMEAHALSYSHSYGYPSSYFPPPYAYTNTFFSGPYGYSQMPPYGAYPPPQKSNDGYPQLLPHGAYPPLGGGGGHHGRNPAQGYTGQGGNEAKMDKASTGGGATAAGAAAFSAAPPGQACFTPSKGEGVTAEAAASSQATATAK